MHDRESKIKQLENADILNFFLTKTHVIRANIFFLGSNVSCTIKSIMFVLPNTRLRTTQKNSSLRFG